MKTRIISVVCMLSGVSIVMGQAEYDDMYFTSKDRVDQVVVRTQKPQNKLNALDETSAAYQAVSPNISMEGYTGRTINPDYQPGGTAVVTSSYFTPNYQPARVNSQLSTNNSNFNNWNNFNSPYSYYGGRYGYGSFYSPYGYGFNNWGYSPYSYGGFYDPYYSNWGYSPYFGYGGMSMYYGMNSGFYGWGSGYYGNGFGCPGYGYPGTVVVVNNPDNHVNTSYGKRQSRSTYFNNNTAGNYSRGSVTTASTNQSGRSSSGRVASGSGSNTYYQRGWRQDPAITQSTTTSGSRSGYSGTSTGTRSGWSSFGNSNNNTRTSWGNTNSSFSGTSPSRSSMSTGSFSGGSRSSGSSFSGGSSGGSRSSGSSGGSRRGN